MPIIVEIKKSGKEEWEKITNKYFVEPVETEPQVNFSIDRNAIEFTIRYIVDYKKRRSTKNEIINEILSKLKKSGIKVSIAKIPLDINQPVIINTKDSDYSNSN